MTELIFYWFDLILSKQYKLTSFQRRRKIKLLKLQYNNKKQQEQNWNLIQWHSNTINTSNDNYKKCQETTKKIKNQKPVLVIINLIFLVKTITIQRERETEGKYIDFRIGFCHFGQFHTISHNCIFSNDYPRVRILISP